MASNDKEKEEDVPIYSLGIYKSGTSKIKWKFRTNERKISDWYQHLNSIKNYCRTNFVVLYREQDQKAHIRTHKVGCNSWDCKLCAQKKASHLKRRIEAATVHSSWRFATLTIDPKMVALKDSLTTLNQRWDVFLKKLRRRFDDLKIIRFVEFHANGYPHIHLFLNHYIPKQLLRNLWMSCGGGEIVDIRMVKNDVIFRYCIKYLSPDKKKYSEHDRQFYIFRIRRFNATRNFFIPTIPQDFVAVIKATKYGDHQKQLDNLIQYISKNYATVCYLEPDEIWFFDPFT